MTAVIGRQGRRLQINAWFPSTRIRSSVPASLLSVAKVRKNFFHP